MSEQKRFASELDRKVEQRTKELAAANEELRARVAALIRSKTLLERAEKAEAMLAKVLDDAPDALLSVDAQGTIT